MRHRFDMHEIRFYYHLGKLSCCARNDLINIYNNFMFALDIEFRFIKAVLKRKQNKENQRKYIDAVTGYADVIWTNSS